jgi:uncharacterized protein YcsI (UPF0317 family)
VANPAPALSGLSAAAARARIRRGDYTGQTAGVGPGMAQGNIAILPADWAEDFLRFCLRNPKPCPLLAVGEPGRADLPGLGRDIDIRTDVPRYRVFRDGVAVDAPSDVLSYWRNDLVTFVLGCSLSFEWPLIEAGLAIRHIEAGTTVPMYRTKIETAPAGRFHGKLVVSMRPFRPADAIRAVQVTSRFPGVHGAPVHLGLPAALGIADLARPDFGEAVTVRPDEIPVFWACGVTPQLALAAARPQLAITHSPGCMFITDLADAAFREYVERG